MSLKVVHIVFIVASVLLAFGFGVWGVYVYAAGAAGAAYLAMGLAASVLGVGLVVYGIRLVQRFRHVRNL